MLTRVEALNFRCLRYVSRPLDRFHVLVGPNASGKTTFFDVVGFVSRLLKYGLGEAIEAVSPDPLDLLFGKTGDRFELAIEAAIPIEVMQHLRELSDRWSTSPEATQGAAFDPHSTHSRIRYKLIVSVPQNSNPVIHSERVLFIRETECGTSSDPDSADRRFIPDGPMRSDGTKNILHKYSQTGKYAFSPEVWPTEAMGHGGGLIPGYTLGDQRSVLSNIPEDENLFPATVWFKRFLSAGVQQLTLDSLKLRLASPRHKGDRFEMDGSNLPWLIAKLEATPAYQDWIDHLQTALPDLVNVRTVEREEDRSRYLKLKYSNGLEIPSWMTSDGTLRLLALTLPAFIDDFKGILLIEEPENGIHPRAIETIFQALSGVTNAQVLVATHSPIILNIAEPKQILCFAKNEDGATDIIRGDEHPALVDWQHEVSLGTLFAGGALG